MAIAIIRRRNRSNKITGYTVVERRDDGRYYADAKIGGQYYGPINYAMSGAIEFKTVAQCRNELMWNVNDVENVPILDADQF